MSTAPTPSSISSLQAELRQGRPFGSLADEAHLSVLRTAEVLARGTAELLRPYSLTPTQYNVLRILRGAGSAGLPCSEIGARMVTHEPDVTRLLDRMNRMGLIARERGTADRRVVMTRITDEGLALLTRLDRPMTELNQQQVGWLSEAELRGLVDVLARVRQACASVCLASAAPDGERSSPSE